MEKSEPKIVKFPMSAGNLMSKIRACAKDRDNIFLKEHALTRINERSSIVEITLEDVHRVLQFGEIDGQPRSGENPGEWIADVFWRQKGSRTIKVVTVVFPEGSDLFVITVMWRDKS